MKLSSTIFLLLFGKNIMSMYFNDIEVINMGLIGIWLGVVADQASRLIMFGLRFRSKKWTKITI